MEAVMSERRRQRVAEEIKRRASLFIHDELKDPRLGFLTITAVEVNSDLTHATLFISVLGSERDELQTMQALKRARGMIKRDIGDWLRIRTVPEIEFKQDRSIERGARILQIIRGLEHEGLQ
jgi:ribosome-binding factor A